MDFAVTPHPDARVIRRELLPSFAATSCHDYACLALGGVVLAALLTAGAWAAVVLG